MKTIIAALALAAIAALPSAQPADAASKRQAKVYVCHWDETDQEYDLIHVAQRAWDRAHSKHANDYLAEKDAECVLPT